jgi:hypothetical protein
MLKIPAEFVRGTSPAKLPSTASEVFPALPVCLSAIFPRELWWMNRELLELRWGRIINQKMAAVHGKLCTIPPRNSNQ